MRWYDQHQNIFGLSKMYFKRLDENPPSNLSSERVMLNQIAWQTFLYSNDKKLLLKAADWMGKVVQLKLIVGEDPLFDTYANLLYKIGKTAEALYWEEKAISYTYQLYEETRTSYKNVIEKMKRGEPTYIEQGAIWK
jgi:hypothetical protein